MVLINGWREDGGAVKGCAGCGLWWEHHGSVYLIHGSELFVLIIFIILFLSGFFHSFWQLIDQGYGLVNLKRLSTPDIMVRQCRQIWMTSNSHRVHLRTMSMLRRHAILEQ